MKVTFDYNNGYNSLSIYYDHRARHKRKKMEGVLNIDGITCIALDETTRSETDFIADLSDMVKAYTKVHDE